VRQVSAQTAILSSGGRSWWPLKGESAEFLQRTGLEFSFVDRRRLRNLDRTSLGTDFQLKDDRLTGVAFSVWPLLEMMA
jgi:hypothetical protein